MQNASVSLNSKNEFKTRPTEAVFSGNSGVDSPHSGLTTFRQHLPTYPFLGPELVGLASERPGEDLPVLVYRAGHGGSMSHSLAMFAGSQASSHLSRLACGQYSVRHPSGMPVQNLRHASPHQGCTRPKNLPTRESAPGGWRGGDQEYREIVKTLYKFPLVLSNYRSWD